MRSIYSLFSLRHLIKDAIDADTGSIGAQKDHLHVEMIGFGHETGNCFGYPAVLSLQRGALPVAEKLVRAWIVG